jgi:hypothetical protein
MRMPTRMMKTAQVPKRYAGSDMLKISRKGQLKRSIPNRKRNNHISLFLI